MKAWILGTVAAIAAYTSPAAARELEAYLQCVPYARDASGIAIYGDAHSWWNQAEGRYERGRTPREGAVMSFPSHRGMRLGHVATVSKVVDSRRVLLSHANWSPIDGRRGRVELDVPAIDVSPNNDWSQVRVWYAPIGALGSTPWPVNGFIYPQKAKTPARGNVTARIASARSVKNLPSVAEAFADFGPVAAR